MREIQILLAKLDLEVKSILFIRPARPTLKKKHRKKTLKGQL